MSKLIKTNLGLIFFFFFPHVIFACGIKSDQKIYLFSGAIAAAAYRLDLYQDPQIKGMLSYYEFVPTPIKKFLGGIYLSPKMVEEIDDKAVIFLEESLEMEKTLTTIKRRQNKKWDIIKIQTTGVDPVVASQQSLNSLQPYLDENCTHKLKDLRAKINNYQTQVEKSSTSSKSILFFTGKWRGKFPETSSLVLYQQDFINYLVKLKKIKYQGLEGDAKFSNWSAKVFNQKETTFIGITSELKEVETKNSFRKIDENKFEIECFACLLPGLLQLEWLNSFMSQKLI